MNEGSDALPGTSRAHRATVVLFQRQKKQFIGIPRQLSPSDPDNEGMTNEQRIVSALTYINDRISEIDSDMALVRTDMREILSGMRAQLVAVKKVLGMGQAGRPVASRSGVHH